MAIDRPTLGGREGGLDSATALLESLHDDAIGTSEEEQSRTPGGGSVPSSTSERTTGTSRGGIDTNAECHHDTAACGSRQEETRRRRAPSTAP
ncbi:hypothetical protein CesoFtcFv8_000342 [Champsocephalus esox]|uniref:Uncharacterized protein n=1 Tax=Champsocephalus esox TaxID=159716 RepID=A0AAN8DQ75_9TELE|nr:hypothetical protein CesoFtcFv8_000342 [Champsocephalus esox]